MPREMTEDEIGKLLDDRHVSVLTTIGKAGDPVSTPIWYLHRDGVIHILTGRKMAKMHNIRRDPRVSIVVQDERPPYRAVSFRGVAEISDAPDWLRGALVKRYLGAVAAAATGGSQDNENAELMLSIRTDRAVSLDYGPDMAGPAGAWLWLKRFLPKSL